MSFLHGVRVGYFGTQHEKHPARELEAGECLEWLRRFNECAPEPLRVRIEATPRGSASRGMVLASADGHPITLKAGILTCPVLATDYVRGSIAFVAFLHELIDCSIYSDDEGRFLTADEIVPRESFPTTLKALLPAGVESAVSPGPATDRSRN